MEKRMVWLGIVVMVVGLCSSGALATTIGTPVATLKAQQISVGPVYSISDMGLDGDGKTKKTASTVVQGTLDTPTEDFKFDEDFDSDMIFAYIGYGASDNLEVFARLGMADLGSGEFSSSQEFAWGLGAKATFYEEAALKLGALLQITFGSASDDTTVTIDDPLDPGERRNITDVPTDVDWYEIKIAVGPSYQLMEGVSVYGGPFYHMFRGDLEAKDSGTDDIGGGDTITWSVKRTADIEEQSQFGGYIGAQVDLAENIPLCLEYQFTGDANIFGAGLVYMF
jgi:hypothetical protein